MKTETKQKTKKEKLALLKDTVEYYKTHRRSFKTRKFFNGESFDTCAYFGGRGIGCAIGRHIPDKKLCRHLDEHISDPSVENAAIFEQLPKDLQAYGQRFLTKLQSLHDEDGNWTNSSEPELAAGALTVRGKGVVANLRKLIKQGKL